MSEVVALCGYRCDLCPAYDENIKNKDNRQEISEGWKRYFEFEIPSEEIGCVGYISEGKHADVNCPIRPCALEKKVENYAHCDNFLCEKLQSRVEFIERLLEKCANNVPEEDYRLFFEPYLSRKRLLNIRDRIGKSEPKKKSV